MTNTYAPPAPPHQGGTQLHSDDKFYANCSCGWHSVPCANRASAEMLGREHVNPTLTQSSKGLGNGWKVALVLANSLFAVMFIADLITLGDATSRCAGIAFQGLCERMASSAVMESMGVTLLLALVVNAVIVGLWAMTRRRD
jgi:hypothetical protein